MRQGIILALLLALVPSKSYPQSWIRVNQLGYQPESVKVAVLISELVLNNDSYEVRDALSGRIVFRGRVAIYDGSAWGMKGAARLDFTPFKEEGGYYITCGDTRSEPFAVGNDVYNGVADYLLRYIRAQRCGFNPFLNDSCHVHDGIIVDHPTLTGKHIDVVGGYHDASDHLRYTATTATSVYQMMYAYDKSPGVFRDSFNSSGMPGGNGIPDIVDEIRWGLAWLIKMNPDSGMMFNQVADDRDHRGFRLPDHDNADYGLGKSRPVYFVTGKPQGLAAFKNRTEGVASTAGKFASVFARGSVLLAKDDPELSAMLVKKARDAWEYALTDPGATQTACYLSPYFYEEDNYVDDLELAAWELFYATGDSSYLSQADYWGTLEPVTPWIITDTARHYQYYPFVNLGHANLADSGSDLSGKYRDFMRHGLEIMEARDPNDVFQVKIPFIWCSDNYISAALTQCRAYYDATGDDSFRYMEAAMRDWLFGCNPWGSSMICGLPLGGDYPRYPHSAVTKELGMTTYGGLVDGPVYKRIYSNLKGLTLLRADEYQPFQHGNVVYHDDIGDYSSNEPTLDGTAGLCYYLSSLENDGSARAVSERGEVTDSQGALVRIDTTGKSVFLVFSADEYGDGFDYILTLLNKYDIKASFFLTGNFLRNRNFRKTVRRIIDEGHYVGPHSDRHLLYMPWDNRDSLLVTKAEFTDDLRSNIRALRDAGYRESPEYFLAPYEWYNSSIVNWSRALGLRLINLTPGTATNADYTIPGESNYRSSQQLIERLRDFEESSQVGLDGAIILIHPGTAAERTDKLYMRLGEIIEYYSKKGYRFNRL